jgi:energy-coupling factor transporter ATP-binding protein EcfA2
MLADLSTFFDGKELIALAGPRGSGKTEIALNMLGAYPTVQVYDADMYKPLMRARDVAMGDRREGSENREWKFMDTPVIEYSPEIWLSQGYKVVLDMGGGELGLVPLTTLQNLLRDREIVFYVVVNPYRPQAEFLLRRILTMLPGNPNFILNPHLLDETDVETVLHGVELYKNMHLDEPKVLVALEKLVPELEKVVPQIPLFPINRFLKLEV